MTFSRYANFYDPLYQDKDYSEECDFLERIFSEYSHSPVKEILDLGCGTGGHALLLSQRGYVVTGVDISEQMLDKAKVRAAELGIKITLLNKDIQRLNLNKTFDAVISMFAVMSYQTTNEKIDAAVKNAREHLKLGGIFMFDAWFGPGVLTDRPQERIKIVETEGEKIIRFATPRLDIITHTVEVNYKILRIKGAQVLEEVEEVHNMRFFFPQEVLSLLDKNQFRLLDIFPFMNPHETLDTSDWSFCVVAEAV